MQQKETLLFISFAFLASRERQTVVRQEFGLTKDWRHAVDGVDDISSAAIICRTCLRFAWTPIGQCLFPFRQFKFVHHQFIESSGIIDALGLVNFHLKSDLPFGQPLAT